MAGYGFFLPESYRGAQILDPSVVRELKNTFGQYTFVERDGRIFASQSFDDRLPSTTAQQWQYNTPITQWLNDMRKPAILSTPVQLQIGYTLYIVPATALPRKIYFSSKRIDDALYPTKHRYGALAYQLYDTLLQKQEIAADETVIECVGEALKASYDVPLEILEAEELLSPVDIQQIIGAALGVPEAVLREELKKFNLPSASEG